MRRRRYLHNAMNNCSETRISVYTIGHSNRTWGEFIELLEKFAIQTIGDIRSLPGSRKFPHFDRENMQKALPNHEVRYIWLPKLGGLRRVRKGFESPNTGLTSPGFRAYADYMLTQEFREGVQELLTLAFESATGVMCAEAVYWRCHRRLLSDYLTAHGIEVLHIQGRKNLVPHNMTQGASVTPDGRVIYLPS